MPLIQSSINGKGLVYFNRCSVLLIYILVFGGKRFTLKANLLVLNDYLVNIGKIYLGKRSTEREFQIISLQLKKPPKSSSSENQFIGKTKTAHQISVYFNDICDRSYIKEISY